MTYVVAERTISGPFTADEVRARIRSGKWCNDLYGLTHCGSLLAPEIDRLVCIYRAPDAEAVRSASDRGRFPYDRVWAATVHGPAGPEPLTMREEAGAAPEPRAIVVQRVFDSPAVIDELQAQEDAHGWCLDAHRVRFLQSLFSIDRRRMLCLYAAPDAEAVRHAQHQAGLPFEQVWGATLCSL